MRDNETVTNKYLNFLETISLLLTEIYPLPLIISSA